MLSGRRQAPLDEVVDAIIAAGGTAEAAQLDVADASATQSIADEIMARHGGVDIFFANAGQNVRNRTTRELTAEAFDQVIDINLNGVMYGIIGRTASDAAQRCGDDHHQLILGRAFPVGSQRYRL